VGARVGKKTEDKRTGRKYERTEVQGGRQEDWFVYLVEIILWAVLYEGELDFFSLT
jgi:hypothetical protein